MVKRLNDDGRHPQLLCISRQQIRLSEGQCDACPPSGRLAAYPDALPLPPGLYSLPDSLTTERLKKDLWVAYAPAASAGPAVLNGDALTLLRTFEQPRALETALADLAPTWGLQIVEDILSKMRVEGLLAPESPDIIPHLSLPTTLVAWLHLTEKCNLNCSYCYVRQSKSDMSLSAGRAGIDAVFRSAKAHHFSTVKLKYAGGEPLLRLPQLAALHRYAREKAACHHLNLDGVIITNGTLLTEQMITILQELGLRLVISLDGLAIDHNRQRCLSGKRGSWTSVIKGMNQAISAGLIPHICTTITERSLAGLPKFVRWMLDHDLPFGLNFYRTCNSPVTSQDLRPKEQEMIETMRLVFKVIEENLPRRSLLTSLLDRTNLAWPHTYACGAGKNYLVVDTQGRIAKCQMDIGQTVTDVFADDPLSDVQTTCVGIQNAPVDQKEDCADCSWRYWCGGGCPLEAYRTTGQWNTKSVHCHLYQELFPDLLRLEGLRLLKHERTG